MKKISTFLSLLLIFGSLFAQNRPKISRTSIFLDGRNIQEIARLGLEVDHGEFRAGVSITSDFADYELDLVKKAGFRTEIIIDDVTAFYKNQNQLSVSNSRGVNCDASPEWPTATHFELGSMGGYFTLDECYAQLALMAAEFPNLITTKSPTSSIKTIENRDQFFVKISDNPNINEAEPELMYTALHHAREPLGMHQMIQYMWYLLENYGQNNEVTTLVNNLEMYFVPIINPDGYEYNRSTDPDGGGYWRKNRRINADGTEGVDLNRNYGFQWGFDDTGSSPNGNAQTYRGTEGFSEPETQSIRTFCEAHQFKVALNYHTFGNLLIYPWGYLDGSTPDSTRFIRIAKWLTKENNFKKGFASQTVNYTVNGTSDDWMYGESGTKPAIYALTPEVSTAGFWPASSDIEALCKTTMFMNLTAAKFVLDAIYLTDESAEYLPAQFFGKIPFKLDFLGLDQTSGQVSMLGLTPNVTSTGASQPFSLGAQESVSGEFSFTLDPNTQFGDEIWFEITSQNGLFTQKDTLRKIFGGKNQSLYNDSANSLVGWENGGSDWNLTTESFKSSPSSITDSPFSSYPQAATSTISTKNQVDIPANALAAQLRFWAKWDIEARYDFTTCSVNSTPLCGRYTVTGSINQLPDQPLFDGLQTNWVEECMNLSDFIGQSVSIGFEMTSDDFDERDGFYFDDLTIEITEKDNSVRTINLHKNDFSMRTQPNPARQQTTLFWDNFESKNACNVLIYNQLGQVTYQISVNKNQPNQLQLDVEKWMPGVYFWKVSDGEQQSPTQKLIIGR
jgi:carboxypeptidase T